jgi:hypothetical protein
MSEGLIAPKCKKITACYEKLDRTLEFAGSFEDSNEPSGSIKGRECLDYLGDC